MDLGTSCIAHFHICTVFLFKHSMFRPAAERVGKGLHPPKPAVNSVTTQTAQLPDTSDAATDSPQHLRLVPTRRLPPSKRSSEDLRGGRRPSCSTKAKAGAGREGGRENSTATGIVGEVRENSRPREQRTPPTQRARQSPATPETPLRPPGRTRPSPARRGGSQ